MDASNTASASTAGQASTQGTIAASITRLGAKVVEVVKPHHIGAIVTRGPTWDYDHELDDGGANLGKVVIPPLHVLKEWTSTCLGVAEFQNINPLGGWSPARSCCVEVFRRGEKQYHYYKAGDLPTQSAVWLGAKACTFSYDLAHKTNASADRLSGVSPKPTS